MDTDNLIGQVIAHYKVLEKLGEGGMGVVYRAVDTRLDRMVALKILPAAKLGDPERKRRFIHEAKTASSLNHPNIVTIYDIGAVDDINYIAMEYVHGQTLHQCIGRKALPIPETLRHAVQIADALSAAHAAGIIHRDLKPANIMVTDRGRVKVLDFGLAKLTEFAESQEMTATLDVTPRTLEGMVVGTFPYMSPEQAEGKKVDARSDIFSFGSVLYEMVTGQRAFQGGTHMSTVAAILAKEPSPITEVAEGVPRELERLILRCLRKEPERRVQHMDDLKLALEELKDESVSGRLAVPPSELQRLALRSAPRRAGPWLAGAALVLLGAAISAIAWWSLSHSRAPAGQPVLSRLTSDSGLGGHPALSPDGRLLAYASDRGADGGLSIWVQQIGGGEPIRLTRHEADDYDPAFSPDGTKIAFRSEREGGGIYVVSALGGEPRLIAQEGRRPRFSPDGNWIACWTGAMGWVQGSSKMYVVPADGGQPKQVRPEFTSARNSLWMPGGKHLLFLGRLDPKRPRDETLDWWIAPLDGGAAVRTGAFDVFRAQKLSEPLGDPTISPGTLTPDGERVIFSATLGDTTNLWQVPISPKTGKVTGEATRITFGSGLELQPSVAVGPKTLLQVAFANLNLNVDVWSIRMDPNQGKAAAQLERVTQDLSFDGAPSASADGKKLVFISLRSGNGAVWIRDLDTGKEKALTAASRSSPIQPKISADGSKVVYGVRENQKYAAYMVSSAGGVVQKVCDDCGPPTHVSADGRKVLLESENHSEAIFLLDTASGKQVELIRPPEAPKVLPFAARFSPDERWVAFHLRTNPATRQVWIAMFHGDKIAPRKDWIPMTDGSTLDREPYWSPDGNLLYFVSDRDRFYCIWAQRLHPATKRPVGPAFAVRHFHHGRRSFTGVGPGAVGLALTPDRMFLTLGEITGNIWMKEGEGH